jgi:hypothetical protein
MINDARFLRRIAESDLSIEVLEAIALKSKHAIGFFKALVIHVLRIGNLIISVYLLKQIKAHEKEEDEEKVSETLIKILSATKDTIINPKDCDTKYSFNGAPYSHYAALNSHTFSLMQDLLTSNPSLLKRKDKQEANIMFYAAVSDSVLAL